MTKIENNNKLIETLTYAIVVENTVSICYGYISSLVKNGKTKNKFRFFSKIAKANKELLVNHITVLKARDYTPDEKYNFCKADIENFSLIGAVNLAMEIASVTVKVYKILLILNRNSQNKKLFRKLLKEKGEQIGFLRKEKKFHHYNKIRYNPVGLYQFYSF